MMAKGLSLADLQDRNPATPMAPMVTAAVKLAEAEKHISLK
jgi:hypothetical protein